jgi:hypothetical protein
MPETALWNLPAANEPTAAEPRAQFSTFVGGARVLSEATLLVWIFNLWGSADFVFVR